MKPVTFYYPGGERDADPELLRTALRAAADTTLQANIDAEASTRAAADRLLPELFARRRVVGDEASVRAPAKAVAQGELLFIHPIEGAVDDLR